MADPPARRPHAMPAGFREELPERVLASTTRADGTTRKPVRIRAGYVNQDEVAKYSPGAFRRQKMETSNAVSSRNPTPRTPERGPVTGGTGSGDHRFVSSGSDEKPETSGARAGHEARKASVSCASNAMKPNQAKKEMNETGDEEELESFEEWAAQTGNTDLGKGVGGGSSSRGKETNVVSGRVVSSNARINETPEKKSNSDEKNQNDSIESPLDEWSALDDELIKALSSGAQKKASRRR